MKNLYISKGFYPKEYFHPSARYIKEVQLPSGAIPWFEGGILDSWDHVESAMGLCIAGLYQEARKAYLWLAKVQEPDGSFYPCYADSTPLDRSRKESHHAPYLATGLWHYYLITGDRELLQILWPNVQAALDFACELQSEEGEIYWARDESGKACKDALVTGCSSIYKSLDCGLQIAGILGFKKQSWAQVRERLGKAISCKKERFDRTWPSKARYAMDWFYPILSGVLDLNLAQARLKEKWSEFVQPGLGCLCVSDEPWVTVAESCELVLALLAARQYSKAAKLFSWLHHNRCENGAYWTGYQFDLDIYWPDEKPTWTAGAVLLAADGVAKATPAANFFIQSSPAWTEHIELRADTSHEAQGVH